MKMQKAIIYEKPRIHEELENLIGKKVIVEHKSLVTLETISKQMVYSGIIKENKKEFYEVILQNKVSEIYGVKEFLTKIADDKIIAYRILKEKLIFEDRVISLGFLNDFGKVVRYNIYKSSDSRYPKLLKMLQLNGMWEEPN
ncbi:MAG: hypothetical protein AABW90_00760 [Nanoarchaeota archaeon]